MISFLDRAFCGSQVAKHTCGRELTPELKKQAQKWWGGPDYPVAYGKFCKEQ
jgi:hypothetical protein